MTRKLFFLATTIFWLGVLGIWFSSGWWPASSADRRASVERRFKLIEVAQHAKDNDCWMAINGKVYDLSAYIPEHPSRPDIILPWCGEEASEAYQTKTKGRKHSPTADQLLETYQIGLLQTEQ